ncbi:peroxidase 64 [Cucumis melo var. makuwa]|uniref:Peroxidase 64 n=1 Tax=Cucumis melo var. makuwa TaxID=1194695 RepID=A0A5D3BS80_CUCMM|nr:peroxidase 64 [Cucumis melo var. makuwa]
MDRYICGLIDGLPKSTSFEVIFVVVDRMSKYAHFMALKHPYMAKSVVELFEKEIVRLHGYSRSIVSDRDRVFVSNFRNELFKLAGTELHRSPAYHPQNNGQTEVVNRGAVYGRLPPPLLYFGDMETSNSTLDQQLKDRDIALGTLKEHLCIAQEKMKKQADLKRRAVEFQVDDMVFLKLIPYRQLSLTTTFHPVFHVSHLKRALGDHTQVQQLDSYLTENHEWMTQSDEVYGYKKNSNTKDWEVLISWKGLPPHEATWEDCNDFKHQFSDFHLEDKVDLEEESNVKPPILFTYNRRNNRRNKGKLAQDMLVRDVEETSERGNYSGGPNS